MKEGVFMCCSGNHNHDQNQKQNQNQEKSHYVHNQDNQDIKRANFHGIMMLLCCALPLLLIFSVGVLGLKLGSIFRYAPYLMIAFCLGSHFLMGNHSNHRQENPSLKYTVDDAEDPVQETHKVGDGS